MDSLTHIVLGACIGEAIAGKKLGKKAMLFGAIAQSLPDIDFLAAVWSTPTENLLAHRGFTHSFLFTFLLMLLLATIAKRWDRNIRLSFQKWVFFFGVQLLIHLLIDGLNVYGVGWLEPFSHQRYAFNWIFVADPFYSFWPALSLVMLVLLKTESKWRKRWAVFGIGLSTIYLFYCGYNKLQIDGEVRNSLAVQQISYRQYFSTPAAFNNWLWYIVAETDSGFQIAYRSVFDKKDKIDFHYFPKNNKLVEPLLTRKDIQDLIRFSQGYYLTQNWNDSLVFNDLRFGQIAGWVSPASRFSFYYYVDYPAQNKLLVQRGRFAGWNKKSFALLRKRIKGE